MIPLVGYLVLFNENLLHYIQLSRTLFGVDQVGGAETAGAHVPLRLLSLYFGLCLIAVGSIIHQWFAPEEIKKYGSAPEYIEHEQDHLSTRAYERLERELDRHPDAVEELRVIRTARRVPPTTPEEFDRRFHELQRDVMDLRFRTLDKSHKWARWSAAFLYLVGFAAMIIPSIGVFIRVCRLLVRSIS